MDISDTLAPNSDQLDAIELIDGPRTFTVEKVSKGSAEQPINVHLAEFPRPWRPGKQMRRVLAACWGTDASKWAGRAVQLYYEPDVSFGKDKTGGTRIKAISGIEGTKKVPLIGSLGRATSWTVDPLPATPAPAGPTVEQVQTTESVDELRAMWSTASPDVQAAIKARVAELQPAE